MYLQFTKQFQTGDYAFANWTCTDGISRDTIYQVIKRTPKRVTLAAVYPNGLDRKIVCEIKNSTTGEYALDRNRYYAIVVPAEEQTI